MWLPVWLPVVGIALACGVTPATAARQTHGEIEASLGVPVHQDLSEHKNGLGGAATLLFPISKVLSAGGVVGYARFPGSDGRGHLGLRSVGSSVRMAVETSASRLGLSSTISYSMFMMTRHAAGCGCVKTSDEVEPHFGPSVALGVSYRIAARPMTLFSTCRYNFVREGSRHDFQFLTTALGVGYTFHLERD